MTNNANIIKYTLSVTSLQSPIKGLIGLETRPKRAPPADAVGNALFLH